MICLTCRISMLPHFLSRRADEAQEINRTVEKEWKESYMSLNRCNTKAQSVLEYGKIIRQSVCDSRLSEAHSRCVRARQSSHTGKDYTLPGRPYCGSSKGNRFCPCPCHHFPPAVHYPPALLLSLFAHWNVFPHELCDAYVRHRKSIHLQLQQIPSIECEGADTVQSRRDPQHDGWRQREAGRFIYVDGTKACLPAGTFRPSGRGPSRSLWRWWCYTST